MPKVIQPNQRKPLISIVTVAGPKRTKELISLLNSVEQSSYKNYETIVVDNSENRHLARIITQKFPQVRYFCMPHNTGVLGFNVGLVNAKGEYILTLDDDCTIRPNTLDNIATIFAKKGKKVAIISANIFEPASKKFIYADYFHHNLTNLCIASNAAVFRKAIFDKVGYYDSDFFLWAHEDDFAIRVSDHGYQIHLEQGIIVDHHPKNRQVIRKDMLFYWSRNLAWFNIKHFSIYLWPMLFVKNIISFILFYFECRSKVAIPYTLGGYLIGWLFFLTPLKKRKVVNLYTQLRYLLKFSLFSILD